MVPNIVRDRRRTGILGAVALTIGLAAVPVSQALAAPGDNGDIKVHSADTPVGDERDEPQVCEFYLDAFDFDGVKAVYWQIDEIPPTGNDTVSQGVLRVNDDGSAHTATMSLPDGHYGVTWRWATESGQAKSKNFKVDCGDNPSPSPTPDPTKTPTPDPTQSPTPDPTKSPAPDPTNTPDTPDGSDTPGRGDQGSHPVGGVDAGGGGLSRPGSAG
ncbi:hypothetical protein ACOKM5_41125 [Streptomyces sp. BH097]|uniref:hypothetical protein n=1 Tax=unclassified Streptomyces TaxID=2593676 RepID=UPI003BB4A07B